MSLAAALRALASGRFAGRLRFGRSAGASRPPVSAEMSTPAGASQVVDQRPTPAAENRPWLTGHFVLPELTSVVAVTSLAVIAAVLRLWRLSAVGFRGDEAVYAGQAALLAHTHGMDRWFILASRGNSNFFVFQWIVAQVYRIFGVSDTAARVVSASFSTLTVIAVYGIGRLLYGRRAGFLAGLILAVSGYAVGLGRLALLDSTAAFFVTAAMFCLLKWHIGGRTRWLAGFGIMTAIAMQAKVTSVLVLPIALVFVAVSGDWRHRLQRRALLALGVSLVAFAPAAIQIVHHGGQLTRFLATSTNRVSGVSWSFYLGQLWQAEGLLMFAILVLALVWSVVRRDRRDLLPGIWLVLFVLFLQLYPLKGFNYLLPAIPPLALIAGRCSSEPVGWLIRHARARLTIPAVVAAAAVTLLLCASQFTALRTAIDDENSAGMREAAYWLRAQGAEHAGSMTLSHGSGQYVLSFYGGIDAYPYGRFRIATVLPGGQLMQSKAGPGSVPLDWVTKWPAQLIEQGRVSYLIYNTRPLDDPPEQNQVSDTVTERQFRSLIQAFSGRLVHVVYEHHEARVYIYRVTKNLAKPALSSTVIGNRVVLTAKGFLAGSAITVSYHGSVVAHGTTNDRGVAQLNLAIPDPGQSQYHVVVTDAEGNTASMTGLPSSKLVYTVESDLVKVYGVRFTPHSRIRLTYGLQALGSTIARPDGTFSWSFRLPSTTHTHYRIRARDDVGHVAWAIGLEPPSVAFAELGNKASVTGAHYLPNSTVVLAYHGVNVATALSDNAGAFRTSFDVPPGALPGYQLVAIDPIGRRASVVGLDYKR